VTSSQADVATFRDLGVPDDRIVLEGASVHPRPVATVVDRRRGGTLPISVIIPLRNRAGADVRNALASLAWQRGGRPWEIILVSQGSDPAIDAELRDLARDAGATLITVGTPAQPWCKPLALNTGILATDPAIAFVMTMDGDMMLANNLLETVLAELRDDPRKLVLCQSSDLPQDCELPTDAGAILSRFDELRARAVVRGKFGTGGIQATSRSFLVDVRGYDEDMLWWGALDTDMVRRAEASGLRTVWISDHTAMLHQWHPRKYRVLPAVADAGAAQRSWQRNHELMIERAGHVRRNTHGWGAAFVG
jgi:glycosyltransferase involved in cell wall biosynthesis